MTMPLIAQAALSKSAQLLSKTLMQASSAACDLEKYNQSNLWY
jgi:hypothetical protein